MPPAERHETREGAPRGALSNDWVVAEGLLALARALLGGGLALAGTRLALVLAAADGPGRGDNPTDLGGILVIIGVILLAALVLAGLAALLVRRTRRSRGADVNPP